MICGIVTIRGGEGCVDYRFLLDLTLILVSTKFLGLLFQRIRMPQVVGALVAGLILGPAVLGIVHQSEFLQLTAEAGVILLMFTSGLETDVKELKSCGRAAFIIALLGVLLPLGGGLAAGMIFYHPSVMAIKGIISAHGALLQNIFIGIILTATSVSITVQTLRELGRLRSRVGTAILGAAIIDDVLGIIALTIVTSFADEGVSVIWVLVKIALFFVFAVAVGLVFSWAYRQWTCATEENRPEHAIVAFAFCLILSYLAEHVFGVADITGAFVAGLMLSDIRSESRSQYLDHSFETVSFLYLSPVFFASIGLQVELDAMGARTIAFTIVLTIVAVLSKVFGCGLGAKLCRYTGRESIQIGTGMISRGEVALIVASKGAALGLIGGELFGPVIVVVVVTTIVTPILLKLVFRDEPVPAQSAEPIA